MLAATEQRIQAENAFEVIQDSQAQRDSNGGAPADDQSGLEDAVVQGRKDLAATALKVEVAKLNTTVMKLNWLPKIDGKFDLIYSENTGFVDEPFFWTAGIQASLPLWDGGAKLAKSVGQPANHASQQSRSNRLEKVSPTMSEAHGPLTKPHKRRTPLWNGSLL